MAGTRFAFVLPAYILWNSYRPFHWICKNSTTTEQIDDGRDGPVFLGCHQGMAVKLTGNLTIHPLGRSDVSLAIYRPLDQLNRLPKSKHVQSNLNHFMQWCVGMACGNPPSFFHVCSGTGRRSYLVPHCIVHREYMNHCHTVALPRRLRLDPSNPPSSTSPACCSTRAYEWAKALSSASSSTLASVTSETDSKVILMGHEIMKLFCPALVYSNGFFKLIVMVLLWP